MAMLIGIPCDKSKVIHSTVELVLLGAEVLAHAVDIVVGPRLTPRKAIKWRKELKRVMLDENSEVVMR